MPWAYADRPRLYRIFCNMRSRCHNPNFPRYPDYGGRGIDTCLAWRHFRPFRDWANAHGYAPDLVLDRIDNAGNYEPDNCRWIGLKVQARNKRNNRLLTMWGETKTAVAWCEDSRACVAYPLLRNRLHKGWDTQRALTQPREVIAPKTDRMVTHAGETLPVHAWATRLGVWPGTLYARIARGMPDNDVLAAIKPRKARAKTTQPAQ